MGGTTKCSLVGTSPPIVLLLSKRTDAFHDTENEDGPQGSAVVRLGQREMWGGHREQGRQGAAVGVPGCGQGAAVGVLVGAGRGPRWACPWVRPASCPDCSVRPPQADPGGAPAASFHTPLRTVSTALSALLPALKIGLLFLFAKLSIFH